MSENETPAPAPSLDGARVWLVSDGTADAAGWQAPFVKALREVGAASVDVLGVSGVLSYTARGIIGQGAEKVARTLRLSRRGEPDASAFDAISGGRPDIVVVDHPGILRTLDIIRDTSRVETVHIALLSGVVGPQVWVGARADAYISGDPILLERIKRPGLADVAAQLAGPPVPAGFEKPIDRVKARAEFEMADDERVILVDTAGLPPESIERVMTQLSLATGLTLLFHYGSDHVAADTLRRAAAAHGVKAAMFGHVEDLEAYAAVADCVFAGPDAPIAAYLAIDIPVVAIGRALEESGFAQVGAIVLAGESTIGGIARQIASDGVADSHRDAARDAIEDDPTGNVAAAIARVWASRDQLKASLLPIQPAVSEASSAGGHRFERIGDEQASTQVLTPLSRQAAKEELAALIMEERKLEKEIAGLATERDRWFDRLNLAEQSEEPDLIAMADGEAKRLTAEISASNERIDAIQAQKDTVRRRAAVRRPGSLHATPPQASDSGKREAERRFLELERESELERLRRRALGDE
jgi:hypothetical protein